VNTVLLVALAAIGFLGLVLLFVGGLTDIRDLLTHSGWLSAKNPLAKMTRRAEVSRVVLLLQALGIDQDALRRHQSAEDPLAKRASDLTGEMSVRPDISFLRRVPGWTYELEDAYSYRGSSLYLDMMGAMYLRQSHEVALEQIFASWLALLRRRGVIDYFDCLIAPKEGNPLLARAVAEVAGKPLILCKAAEERSRIERPANAASHETDFEGLHAFLQRDQDDGHLRVGNYRALAIDDSCKRGSQICSMIARFNQYMSQGSAEFEPIIDVVTLFRVKGPEGAIENAAFHELDLKLHALVALGPKELKSLKEAKKIEQLIKETRRFKEDPFGCEQSLLLLPEGLGVSDETMPDGRQGDAPDGEEQTGVSSTENADSDEQAQPAGAPAPGGATSNGEKARETRGTGRGDAV
jgi:hypothetical protein